MLDTTKINSEEFRAKLLEAINSGKTSGWRTDDTTGDESEYEYFDEAVAIYHVLELLKKEI